MASLARPLPISLKALDHDISVLHYGNLLQRCVQLKSVAEGKAIHAQITKLGFEIGTFLGNCLVNMYSKCGSTKDARNVFDNMAEHNLVSWNIMIAGYAQQGFGHETLQLFQHMKWEDTFMPDKFTLGSALKACASAEALEEGKQIHCQILKLGFEQNVFVGSVLVDMYSKCGSIKNAWRAFQKLSHPNVVSWNAMLATFVRCGLVKGSLKLFKEMLMAGIEPSHVTFGFVLQACPSVEEGKQLHACVFKNGFGSHLFAASAVILMYMKCGSIQYGRQLFDKMHKPDLGLFRAAIQGYADGGQPEEAMKLFCELLERGMKPNEITLAVVLKTCEAVDQARQLHACVIKSLFRENVCVPSAVVSLYAKCGCIDDARQVFDKMSPRDVVLFTSMIAGYTQKGYVEEALGLFLQMQRQGVKPNLFTYPTVLSAIASLASTEVGKQVHTQTIKSGLVSDVFVGSGLVDMYVKCGNIVDARRTFDVIPKRDIVVWNVMIAGYVQHGYAEAALQSFQEMQQFGIKPNQDTFVAMLSACSQLGLVGLGRRYFDTLSRAYGIIPTMEHYVCMVDLLGRAGHPYEAEDFIRNMPLEPGPLVWETLLHASRNNNKRRLSSSFR